MIKIHGNHYICLACLRAYIKNKTGGPIIVIDAERAKKNPALSVNNVPVMPIKCPARNCEFKFEMDIVSRVMQKREYEITVQKEIARSGLVFPQMPKKINMAKIKCLICYSEVEEDKGFIFECEDSYCSTCLAK